MGNSEIYIDVSVENTPASILSKCRRMKVQHGLDLVIIDYLQLMSSENAADRREGRQQEVSDMSRNIKKYAKELDVPFLVLSQLNRAGEVRGGEPKLSDLRESGSIEQDADFVAFCSATILPSKTAKTCRLQKRCNRCTACRTWWKCTSRKTATENLGNLLSNGRDICKDSCLSRCLIRTTTSLF